MHDVLWHCYDTCRWFFLRAVQDTFRSFQYAAWSSVIVISVPGIIGDCILCLLRLLACLYREGLEQDELQFHLMVTRGIRKRIISNAVGHGVIKLSFDFPSFCNIPYICASVHIFICALRGMIATISRVVLAIPSPCAIAPVRSAAV